MWGKNIYFFQVASHPRHGDGLLGDAINFLLGGAGHAHLAEEQDERFRGYEAAQARGAAGECSTYHAECPLSFFKLIGIRHGGIQVIRPHYIR